MMTDILWIIYFHLRFSDLSLIFQANILLRSITSVAIICAPLYFPVAIKLLTISPVLSALLFGTARLMWGSSIAMIIYSCHNGNGGFVNRFLSSNYWKTYSRLCMSLYLSSPIVQYVRTKSAKGPLDLDLVQMVSHKISIIFWYLLPFLTVIRLLDGSDLV
jgi:hypothetical protein